MIYISTRYYGYTYSKGVEDECFDDLYMCYEREAGPSSEAINNHPEAGWIYNSNVKLGESSPYFTWLLSPDVESTQSVYIVDSDGSVLSFGGIIYNYYAVRPVVYLKSSVKITSGDGSSTSPYKLSL